jgi:hypothetical protein
MPGKIQLSWLWRSLELKNGVPSHDAIRRVFRWIQPDAFHELFPEPTRSRFSLRRGHLPKPC